MASPKSLLMCDSTKGYGPAEHVMDYIISYTLRLANNVSSKDTPVLYLYVKNIVSILFEIEMSDFSNIENIKVFKQQNCTDLVVEWSLCKRNDKEDMESHALLIENKHSTDIDVDDGKYQIEKYKEKFEEKYSNEKLHYVLISSKGTDEIEKEKGICNNVGFKCYAMDDLLPEIMKVPDEDDYHYIDTEDPIFNQFWLREWPCVIDS